VDFSKGRGLFRTFANHFEASYEDTEPTLQFRLTDLHCSARSKFEEGDLLNFYKCLPNKDISNLWQKAAVFANLFGSTFVNKLSH
jgi:hypothetical protein